MALQLVVALLNGMKPINEAFLIETPLTEVNNTLLQEYRARLEIALLEAEDSMLRAHVDQKVTYNKASAEDIGAQLERFAYRYSWRGSSSNRTDLWGKDGFVVEKALRKATEIFTDEMIPAFVFLGLGQGGYLRRYQRSCNSKKKQTQELLFHEIAQLFDHIVEDTKKERDFLAMQDGSIRELWERTSTYEKDRLQREKSV